MDAIIQSYKDEINVYKSQVEELKGKVRRSDEKIASLLDKDRGLQDLVEKANHTISDLNKAYEHVREENLKLQTPAITNNDNNVNYIDNQERALEKVQRQYINLTRESVSWISDKDNLIQRNKFLERDIERFKRDNVTLGKQVRHLLKTLEEERGMIIRKKNQVDEYSSAVVSASDVIDKHLVTFESIEELQHQNQQLLSLVKDLTKRDEDRELQAESEDSRRLNKDIEDLKNELQNVKNDRERIQNLFDTIFKEHELLSILLCKTKQVEHMTPEIFKKMVSIACSAGPALMGNQIEDTPDKDAHIIDLKAMISKLEQELTEINTKFEDMRVKNEEEIKVKTELLEEAHLKLATQSQQADFLAERNQVLEGNMKLLMADFDEARTKSQKMSFELEQERQKRQSELATILKEIQSKQDERFDLQVKLSNAENQVASISMQKSQLEEELRLKTESFEREIRLKTGSFEQELRLRTESLNQELKLKVELLQEAHLKISNQSEQISMLTERSQALENDIQYLVCEIKEFQRLRNVERSRRLLLARSILERSKEKGKQPERLLERQAKKQPDIQLEEQPDKPTSQQADQPENKPHQQPSTQHSSRQPDEHSSRQPDEQPSRQPDGQPSKQLDEQPVRQLDEQPVIQLDEQPVRQLDEKPKNQLELPPQQTEEQQELSQKEQSGREEKVLEAPVERVAPVEKVSEPTPTRRIILKRRKIN